MLYCYDSIFKVRAFLMIFLVFVFWSGRSPIYIRAKSFVLVCFHQWSSSVKPMLSSYKLIVCFRSSSIIKEKMLGYYFLLFYFLSSVFNLLSYTSSHGESPSTPFVRDCLESEHLDYIIILLLDTWVLTVITVGNYNSNSILEIPILT